MSFEGFPILPEGALDASVTTTVWIGVVLITLLNRRLGWTYSGLVVPGYLVPLVISKPGAALVIVAEAVVAYGLTWLVSVLVARSGLWCSFFGRDRFFMIVLFSILVRLGGETWFLPSLGEWIESQGLTLFDYRSDLHSFGLIVVALLANQFWKPGIALGIRHFLVTLGLTWAVVRWLLIPLTNFSIGSLELMYEDIAASFLASPKAYVVLITAAWIVSRLNLRFGWDFNGILVPALLALLVFQPTKILMTFIESWVVLAAAHLVLRSRWLRESSIENARKMALFFNVSFFYKFALGWALYLLLPEVKITDAYGFGYLLPTLIAMGMYGKGIAIRLSTVTLTASVASGVLAGFLGFAMTFLPAWGPPAPGKVAVVRATPVARAGVTGLAGRVGEDGVLSRMPRAALSSRSGASALVQHTDFEAWLLERKDAIAERGSGRYVTPHLEDLLYFDREVLAPVFAILERRPELGAEPDVETRALLLTASRAAGRYGYRVLWLVDLRSGGAMLALSEDESKPPRRYWGTYVFRLGVAKPVAVQVPRPVLERYSFEFGVTLFAKMTAGSLALAGAHSESDADGAADVVRLANRLSLFNLVHQALVREAGRAPLLVAQIRGYSPPWGRPPVADLLFALSGGEGTSSAAPWVAELRRAVEAEGLVVRDVDGSEETAGYEAHGLLQARYLEPTGKRLAALWLSSTARSTYRRKGHDPLVDSHFATVGIPTHEGDLVAEIAGPDAAQVERSGELLELLAYYLESRDVVALTRIAQAWSDIRLQRLVDQISGLSYLVVTDTRGRLAAAVHLGADPGEVPAARWSETLAPSPEAVTVFRETRRTALSTIGRPSVIGGPIDSSGGQP